MSEQADLLEEAPAPPPPATDAQLKRALGGQPFRILVKPEQLEWATERGLAVYCIACKHAPGEKHVDPWGSFCLVHRCAVSNAFPKICPQYEAQS